MERLSAWWRVRTERERRLVQVAALFVFAILVPAWTYLSASAFREAAAARLVAARQVETQVARLAEASRGQAAALQGEDNSVRSRILVAAQASGLTPARIEAADPERVRIAFEPADSLSIYRWIEAVGRGGAHVVRSAITRVDDSEQVSAEFEVTGSP